MHASNIDIFNSEVSCHYRGEDYRVRDNGAIFRCSHPEKRKRPLDDTWTFGTPSKSDGYMGISAHKVHRIVAIAYHGEPPTKQHVVDHIDTNRRNNRPDNLRWVTRLENILLNPVTAKRIEYLYGSIESFLANPRTPQNGSLTRDFEWMRTVTPHEAEYSRKRLLSWAESDRPSAGGSLGDWIFGRAVEQVVDEGTEGFFPSRTPGAAQRKWRVPAEFPACPPPVQEKPLEVYFERLKIGDCLTSALVGQN